MSDLIAQVLRASQHRFIGRLARDPEVRYFESGRNVMNCRMLVNQPDAKRDDGQKPDGFKLEMWGEEAQAFADECHKGDLVDVTGRVKTEQWTDRTTGEQRTDLVIKLEQWSLAGKPAPATATATARPAAAPPAPAPAAWNSAGAAWASNNLASTDEVPF